MKFYIKLGYVKKGFIFLKPGKNEYYCFEKIIKKIDLTNCFIQNIMQNKNEPYVIVLGTAQDGGYPQAGCHETCCDKAWNTRSLKEM